MRKWLSLELVKFAKYLWPENPEVNKFYADLLYDLMITGKYITRISPEQYLKSEVQAVGSSEKVDR